MGSLELALELALALVVWSAHADPTRAKFAALAALFGPTTERSLIGSRAWVEESCKLRAAPQTEREQAEARARSPARRSWQLEPAIWAGCSWPATGRHARPRPEKPGQVWNATRAR